MAGEEENKVKNVYLLGVLIWCLARFLSYGVYLLVEVCGMVVVL